MFRKFFRRTPPLKDALDDTIRRLKQQKKKLELLNIKLKGRRSSLFSSCTDALERKDAERAKIFANELAEIKNVQKTVGNGLLLLEQLIIRMETLREVGSTFAQLKPTLEVVKNISEQLAEVMPEVSSELSNIGGTLNDAMINMNIDIGEEAFMRIPEGNMSEEILDQASQFLRDKIEAELPEPPADIGFAHAIVLGEEEEKEEVILRKTAVPKVSPKIDESKTIKEAVFLEYINSNKGIFEIKNCCKTCNIQEIELAKVIEGLSRKGLIKIVAVQGVIANDGDKRT